MILLQIKRKIISKGILWCSDYSVRLDIMLEYVSIINGNPYKLGFVDGHSPKRMGNIIN
jgi:hypothetical protein